MDLIVYEAAFLRLRTCRISLRLGSAAAWPREGKSARWRKLAKFALLMRDKTLKISNGGNGDFTIEGQITYNPCKGEYSLSHCLIHSDDGDQITWWLLSKLKSSSTVLW